MSSVRLSYFFLFSFLAFAGIALADCQHPANAIETENCLAGSPDSEWDIHGSGSGDSSIQGFATNISVNAGQTVSFKVSTNATAYTIDIYRMGYYGGMGARKVATTTPSARLPQAQPACISDAATKLFDCGNWAVSASWAVPADAVSGIYFAHLTRRDTGGDSHIVFIVRNDASHSDILFQTSDETWQAYNDYGGHSLYGTDEFDLANRSFKVSYNRPFDTKGFERSSWVFYAEYPMVRWLEANGYDVSYFTSVDAARNGSLIRNHKLFLSVGHDEYWSGPKRANVEAARDAGVNMAFFSGNSVFWKTRWENSIDGSGTPYRTLVCYKETLNGTVTDPADPPTWTGTWRDPRFSPPGDGGRPENALMGTIFAVNGFGADNNDLPIQVPGVYAPLRFWRNTSVAALQSGQTATLAAGTLGYEWGIDSDNGARPPGLMRLSSTTATLTTDLLLDYGLTYGAGKATHSLTLYRAPSGALVFGAGTVQWSWGLDSEHDTQYYGAPDADPRMQQATVNLFADMGVQPASLQPGLLPATKSTDTSAPASSVTSPSNGAAIVSGTTVTITGTAVDFGGGVVAGVEVSVDGGQSWHPANGTSSWTYAWSPVNLGSATILSRAVDDSANLGAASAGVTTTVAAHDCPCQLFAAQTPPQADSGDASSIELGVSFKTDYDGYITGLRFYKSAANTGTHIGNLWTNTGTLLGSATFSSETASGWQQVNFANPIPVTAGTTYVASYFAPSGHYSATSGYFAASGADNPPVHFPADGAIGSNGVYSYSAGSRFPVSTFASTNYWVDVVFVPSDSMPGSPPALLAEAAAVNFTGYRGQPAPALQTVRIINQGSGTLNWSASASAPWIVLPQTAGTTPTLLSIGVNAAGLANGNYSGTVTVSANGSSQTIAVTLTVSTLLMASNFSAGADGFVPSPLGLAANWMIANGAFQYNGGGHTQMYAGSSAWTDYDLQADVKLSSLADYPGGIRGRVNAASGASYAVWLYPAEGLIRLYKTVAWNINSGATQLGVAGAAFDATNFHNVKLSFRGSQIQVFYDGKLLITATDATYSGGMLALDVSSQPVAFANVLVTSPNAFTGATLSSSTNTVAFTAMIPGANPAGQNVTLTMGTTLAWTAVSSAPWLTVTPSYGVGSVTIQIAADMSSLTPGTYTAAVRVTAFGAANSPVPVNVTFTVNAAPPVIAAAPSSFAFLWTAGQSAPPSQTLTVLNGGYGAFTWSAATDAAWLQATPASGSTPGTVAISVNTPGLAVGSYTGHVLISASGVANSPVSVPVTLQVYAVNLAETFSDQGLGWIVSPMGLSAGWTASGSSYRYNGAGLSQTCSGNSAWTDYTFDTNVQLSNLSNWPGGVRGRVNPATGAGYAMWIYPGTQMAVLYAVPQWNINGPGLTALAQAPLTFDTATHDLQIVFQGSQIRVNWDGQPLMSVTDGSYGSGFVCLDADSQPISYSNVRVAAPQIPPTLAASAASLLFAASPGSTPPAQTVTVSASSAATAWAVASSASWLTATATSTLTPGDVTVTANATGLAEGTYTGTVTISAPGAVSSPMTIPVTFAVKTAALAVSPSALTFFGSTTSNPSAQSVTISNAGTGTLTWTASADATWIGLSATSGAAPATLSITPASSALAPGVYTSTVTISSGDVANGPVVIPVTVTVGTQAFSDDFSAGAGNWTVSPLGHATGWSVASGTYQYDGEGHTQSWAGSNSWTDYTVAGNFQLSSLQDYPGGLRGRVDTSSGASYGVWIYPAQQMLKLFRISQWNIDAGFALLAQASVPIDTNAHNLRLVFRGSQIQVYYDNALAMQATDAAYTQGAIALDVSNQPIAFSNVSVVAF